MENIDKLVALFQPIFDECHVRLYEISWLSSERTLQVSIDNDSHTIDLDTCADVSEKLGDVLDKQNSISQEYSLEVCSPGAEREIKDYQEFDTLIDTYVFVKLRTPFKNMDELMGYVREVKDNLISLEYRDKAVKRMAQFKREDITFARLAIKL